MKNIRLNLKENSYDIHIGSGAINHLKELLNIKGKVMIVSDSGVPEIYYKKVFSQFDDYVFLAFPMGESNKTLDTYSDIVTSLSENGFSRKDSIIALGGGLVSDVAGFVASTFMRGINFYILPTTLLADVDASIGGKVAVNFDSTKNLVGSFYQPKKVIIDPTLLNTLSDRLFFEGLVEAIKMAATYDKELFEFIESLSSRKEVEEHIEEIIYRALLIKKDVVEKDEKEENLRKILNFGHTVGHALEILNKGKLYHGECVGIGMIYFSSNFVADRIVNLLKRFNLPYEDNFSSNDIMSILIKDKKKDSDNSITICYVEEIGKFELRKLSFEEIKEMLRRKKNEK